MTRAIRRTNRRIRPRYLWTGFHVLGVTQTSVRIESILVDPSIYPQTMADRFQLEAVYLSFSIISTTSTGANFSAYVMDFGTDESETVTAGAPWDAAVQDIEIAEKRLLFNIHLRAPVVTAQPTFYERVLKSKRNLKAARAVFLVTQGNSDVNTINLKVNARALVRIG